MRPASEWISGRVLIPDLLRAAPQVRPVLDRYGLRGCGGEAGPAVRRRAGPWPAGGLAGCGECPTRGGGGAARPGR
jgi:hypothetical protein